MSRLGILAATVSVLLLAGCAPPAPHQTAGEMEAGSMPLTPEHTLTAGDDFEIRFPFAPEFNDRVVVGQDGTVSPKLIGTVIVGGLTVPEARRRLAVLYAKRIKAPEISLTVRAYAPEVFWVEGEVARPGLIRSEVPLTVARAVATAGGAKTGAVKSDILVIRRGEDGGVRGYKAALSHRSGAEDPFLKSFDVVYVPQSAIASVNEFVAGYVKNLPFSIGFQVTPAPPATVISPVTSPRP